MPEKRKMRIYNRLLNSTPYAKHTRCTVQNMHKHKSVIARFTATLVVKLIFLW